MQWDEAYKQLEQELGHAPTAEQVQTRMLEDINMDLAVEE